MDVEKYECGKNLYNDFCKAMEVESPFPKGTLPQTRVFTRAQYRRIWYIMMDFTPTDCAHSGYTVFFPNSERESQSQTDEKFERFVRKFFVRTALLNIKSFR